MTGDYLKMKLFTEPATVPDIFASGLADAEYLGDGNIRLTFYRQRRQLDGTNGRGGSVDLEVIACIVMPVDGLPGRTREDAHYCRLPSSSMPSRVAWDEIRPRIRPIS